MRKGGVPVPKNMYTVAGDGPCNEELALRIQAGDKCSCTVEKHKAKQG